MNSYRFSLTNMAFNNLENIDNQPYLNLLTKSDSTQNPVPSGVGLRFTPGENSVLFR